MSRNYTLLLLLAVVMILWPQFIFADNFDILLLKEINLNRNKQLDPFFIVLTNTAGFIAIGFPIIMLIFSYLRKNLKMLRKGYYLTASTFIAIIITNILKYSINRPRPFETYSFIEKVSSGGSPSFPSGHTADAFVFATALSFAFPKKYVIIPAYIWAMLIAYSRMSLGVHYPIDVLSGALIGVVSAWMMFLAMKRIYK